MWEEKERKNWWKMRKKGRQYLLFREKDDVSNRSKSKEGNIEEKREEVGD